MTETFMVQSLEALCQPDPSAHLTQTGFQLFHLYSISISHAMISSSAILNHENRILINFQAPAIEILLTPLQGLKLEKQFFIGTGLIIEILLTPLQGLKLNEQQFSAYRLSD
ncbi:MULTISPECIES: hypothetical protein [Nostocales]|uniref:hypothetical protein n=1 Tax=Nostocales TaxID=1161 RepID=UPI000679023F